MTEVLSVTKMSNLPEQNNPKRCLWRGGVSQGAILWPTKKTQPQITVKGELDFIFC